MYHPTDACNTINQGYNNYVLQLYQSFVERVSVINLPDLWELYDMDCIQDPDGTIDQGMYLHLVYGGQTNE
jgi:hypothetical protein